MSKQEAETDYFSLFKLPVSFRIDEKVLKKVYYQLSREFHPDFFVSASEEEKQLAESMAERVNQAFAVLSDFQSRTEYVLSLHGLINGDVKYQLPQDFLIEMMELNERIESLPEHKSGPEWQALNAEIQSIEDGFYELIESCALKYDSLVERPYVLEEMTTLHFKYKYLLRIRENLTTFAPPL
ncbi:MAG: Fe-S protein assembly co-chaperone HscB [Saprospiraceae bacterium]|jgi:molecular chaperone HscB|nr:Fe-S protein assembly co-chaperone HscB [Saprospiraceae bacterium]